MYSSISRKLFSNNTQRVTERQGWRSSALPSAMSRNPPRAESHSMNAKLSNSFLSAAPVHAVSHFNRSSLACRATAADQPTVPETGADVEEVIIGTEPIVMVEDFEGLEPQDDLQVPGSYFDALNGNTKLGKAVRAACDELEHLNNLEQEMMMQAEELLKKLGVKQPIITKQPQETAEAEPKP